MSLKRITKSKLVKLQKKYGTDDRIGKQFGVTRQAVYQLRKQYGIPSIRIKHPARDAALVKAYQKGLTMERLMKKFGLSCTRIYNILDDNKIGRRKKRNRTCESCLFARPSHLNSTLTCTSEEYIKESREAGDGDGKPFNVYYKMAPSCAFYKKGKAFCKVTHMGDK